jgi:hypothetical protein
VSAREKKAMCKAAARRKMIIESRTWAIHFGAKARRRLDI